MKIVVNEWRSCFLSCTYLSKEVFLFGGTFDYSNKIGNTTLIIESWSRHQIVNNRHNVVKYVQTYDKYIQKRTS